MVQIFSMNIWGAPYASHRSARMTAIAREISRLQPDIITLQEAYMQGNRQELLDILEDQWPHQHYFASSVVGSGLLTLSRFPIVDIAFHRFRMGGKPEDIGHGDYYAGKGIGLTRIDTPGGLLDVYQAHTHAQYERHNDNEYAAYNESNLYEAARFIQSNSGTEAHVILCGDLNTRPDQPGYRIIRYMGALRDAYTAHHGQPDTTFSVDNAYVDSFNQCLDYMLTRNLQTQSIEIMLKGAPPDNSAPAYSDHYALLAEFDLGENPVQADPEQIHHTLTTLHKRVQFALAEAENTQGSHVEKMLLALVSLPDVLAGSRLIEKRFQTVGQWLRRIGLLSIAGYLLYHLVQAGINLQARKQTLQSLERELQIQLESGLLFDDITLPE
jgi:endonuclease/exonuclease/phosphatase family metal-dependent hydrolase